MARPRSSRAEVARADLGVGPPGPPLRGGDGPPGPAGSAEQGGAAGEQQDARQAVPPVHGGPGGGQGAGLPGPAPCPPAPEPPEPPEPPDPPEPPEPPDPGVPAPGSVVPGVPVPGEPAVETVSTAVPVTVSPGAAASRAPNRPETSRSRRLGPGTTYDPVTVSSPASAEPQAFAVQEPGSEMEKVAAPVRSPTSLPYSSSPAAVNAWVCPAVIVAVPGARTTRSTGPGTTLSCAVADIPDRLPVIGYDAATVLVHRLAAQVAPAGAVNVVSSVTSPMRLSYAS